MAKKLTLALARKILNKLGIANDFTNYPKGDKIADPQAIIVCKEQISDYVKEANYGLFLQENKNGKWKRTVRFETEEEFEEYFSRHRGDYL